MDSVNFLGVALFIFLSLFAVYHLYIVFCSSKYNIWKLRYKYSPTKYKQELNVVIYSHNDAEAVVELLENIKKQDYPQDKVKVNIILDNCTDNSSNLLEILGGAKIWRVQNTDNTPVGRNAAIEWLLDRALAKESTNAFVFLDARNKINPMLLNNINNAISEYPVVTGRVHRHSNNKILAPLLSLSEKLKYDISFKGRSMAGFSSFVSTEILAVRQSILERVRFIDVKNQDSEMIYSVLLSKSKVPVLYSDEVYSFSRHHTGIRDLLSYKFYEIKGKFSTFCYCFKLLFAKTKLKTKELVFSLVYPSDVMTLVLLACLVAFSRMEWFSLGYKAPHFLLSFWGVTTLYTCILAKLTIGEILAWPIKVIGAPFVTLGMKFKDIASAEITYDIDLDSEDSDKEEEISGALDVASRFKFSLPSLPKFKLPKFEFNNPFEKEPQGLVKVFVTNGSTDIECSLQEIKEDGLYRAALWFNGKKIVTGKCLRTNDAIKALSDKLLDKGLALKVCQNCGYFEADSDGKHDLNKGKCLLAIIKHGKSDPYSTKVYNSCKFIIPFHAKEYVRKQLENIKK